MMNTAEPQNLLQAPLREDEPDNDLDSALNHLRVKDGLRLVWLLFKIVIMVLALWPESNEFSFLGLWLTLSLAHAIVYSIFKIWRLRKFTKSAFVSEIKERRLKQLQGDGYRRGRTIKWIELSLRMDTPMSWQLQIGLAVVNQMSLMAGLYLLLTGQADSLANLKTLFYVVILVSLLRYILYYLAAALAIGIVLPVFVMALLYNCAANRLATQRLGSGKANSLLKTVRRGDQCQASTCYICFMEFQADSRVIELDCDRRHSYHQICLKTWLQVGSSCPICRRHI